MGVLNWLKQRDSRENADKILHERLAGLERAVERLADKPSSHSITIENLHVHNPSLEHLTFRLDRLDIDELSGALNLGNNFGTRVGKKEAQNKPGQLPKQEESDQQRFDIKKTAAGFKYEPEVKPHR